MATISSDCYIESNTHCCSSSSYINLGVSPAFTCSNLITKKFVSVIQITPVNNYLDVSDTQQSPVPLTRVSTLLTQSSKSYVSSTAKVDLVPICSYNKGCSNTMPTDCYTLTPAQVPSEEVSPFQFYPPSEILTTETFLSQMVLNNSNNNPKDQTSSIVNLSSLVLTQPMITVLSKGLNFCPTPGEADVHQLRLDLDHFHVNLKRQLFFAKRSDPDSSLDQTLNFSSITTSDEESGPFHHQKFTNPSSWCPPAPTTLDAMVITNETLLNEYTPSAPSQQNLTLAEKQALADLKDNHNIVIKAADKGSAVVIQNRHDYIQEGTRQLSDPKFYKEVTTDFTSVHNMEVQAAIDQLYHNNEISKKCSEYLKISQPRTSQLYLLPKIHKNTFPVPGRPIVSANNSPTERISELADHFLQPLVSNTTSYVRDTTDFLNKISEVNDLLPGTILCTVDVTSLYTNIPNDEGIAACRKHLHAYRQENNMTHAAPHTASIVKLLELVLSKNNFDFNNKHYLQVGGTAMGTRVAPSFANLFMAEFEEKHVYTYPTKPSLWLRYIDDIFLIWEHGQEALDTFLEYLNSCHETIKFTAEHSHTCVNFLDTTVYIDTSGSLTTDLYCKPTDAHNYLAYDSAHPVHIKKGLPYSQLLRVRRICTNIADFDKNAIMIANHFRRRGYPDSLIEKALIDVRRKDRQLLLTPTLGNKASSDKDNLFLVTTHIPGQNPLKNIVQENWKILGRTHTTEPIYKKNVIFGQRRNKNLKDILIRATLPPAVTDSQTKSKTQKIMHPCTKFNCRYCSHLDKTGNILSSSTGRSYYTREYVSCQSNNLIYCLTCTKCNLQYVGQTKNKLADRFVVHFNHIQPVRAPRKKKTKTIQTSNPKFDDPIGRHFKSSPHNGLKDVHIHIVQFISAPSNSIPAKLLRDDLERKWIHRLKTLSPLGLNLAD